MIRSVLSTGVFVLGASLLGSTVARADSVTDWNATAGRAALASCVSLTDPMHESRMYAMTQIAVHDVLNALDRRSRPYALHARIRVDASVDAAVAAAARGVLVATLQEVPPDGLPPLPNCSTQTGVEMVEAAYTTALAAIQDGPAKDAGVAAGQLAAAAVLELRQHDGSAGSLLDFEYPQGTEPGEYRFHGLPFVDGTRWGHVTPFVLKHASQFQPAAPYRVSTSRYAADLNEVKSLGSDNIGYPSLRTPEQTEIAVFWYESSPLAWNRIARTVGQARGLDVWESARLLAILNVALADGYIGSSRAKFHYNFWRPVTAIQEADRDGNRRTSAVEGWSSLLPTPPNPDHDSAHSVAGAAAAEVLRLFFGTDRVAFQNCSMSTPGATCDDASPLWRSFSRFSEAARENGVSRILVGLHFRHAVEEGLEHGKKIGARAARNFFQEVGGRR